MSRDKSTIRELNFSEVIERLKLALNVTTQADVAKAMGMSTGDLANRKKRNKIPHDRIYEVASSRNVSLDWLLTGKGFMKTNIPTEASNDHLSPRQRAVLDMFESLTEDQQREILRDVEEKKRLAELEARVRELEQKKNLG